VHIPSDVEGEMKKLIVDNFVCGDKKTYVAESTIIDWSIKYFLKSERSNIYNI
jgi:hypothetical protein